MLVVCVTMGAIKQNSIKIWMAQVPQFLKHVFLHENSHFHMKILE